MKKKRKQWISVLLFLAFLMAAGIVFIGNPVLFFHEQLSIASGNVRQFPLPVQKQRSGKISGAENLNQA